MADSYYQSSYEGSEIDESVGKVQDVFFKKTSILPIDVGGTGQTTIQGIKQMLGIDDSQQGVIQISKGGTGATTADSARKNLGITPDNLGIKKYLSGLGSSSGLLNVPFTCTLSETGIINENCTTEEFINAMPSRTSLTFVNSSNNTYKITDLPSNYAYCSFWKDYNIAYSFGVCRPNRNSKYYLYNPETKEWEAVYSGDDFNTQVKTQVQSLIQGGEISVVKSVQRGTISVDRSGSGIATLGSSVNTAKSIVIGGGQYSSGGSDLNKFLPVKLELTSPTQVTATGHGYVSMTWDVPYQVIEFY